MEPVYRIGEAARLTGLSAETLRYYDRIGLVKPGYTDPQTLYRYYSAQELILLKTIKLFQTLDIPLAQIQRILDCDSLEETIAFFRQAEAQTAAKIAQLQETAATLQRARSSYETHRKNLPAQEGPFVKRLPQRVILCSDTLQEARLDTLWNYLSGFASQLDPARRDAYAFADRAGIYTAGGVSRLFALCTRFPDLDGLTVLRGGAWLCLNCAASERDEALPRLMNLARQRCGRRPSCAVSLVYLTGILSWRYQLQVPLEEADDPEAASNFIG